MELKWSFRSDSDDKTVVEPYRVVHFNDKLKPHQLKYNELVRNDWIIKYLKSSKCLDNIRDHCIKPLFSVQTELLHKRKDQLYKRALSFCQALKPINESGE